MNHTKGIAFRPDGVQLLSYGMYHGGALSTVVSTFCSEKQEVESDNVSFMRPGVWRSTGLELIAGFPSRPVLCHLCVSWVVLHCTGCATAPEERSLGQLQSIPEATSSHANPWSYTDDILTNAREGETLSNAYLQGKEASTALIEGFAARDLELEAETGFSNAGAPALVFRAQSDGGVVTAMYALALHAHGVNLWRFNADGWTLVEAHVFEVDPDTTHVLHVLALADTIAVTYDGKRLFEARDTFLMLVGGAGVRATQGPCRFYSLRATNLD